MKSVYIQYVESKIGELIIGSFEDKLCLLDFRQRKTRNAVDNRIKKGLNAEFVEKQTELIEIAKKQIDEYLAGKRREFDIPLLMVGTEFQKSVWSALMKLPYGETSTYLQLAKSINKESAVRAVANATGANALGLIIPCHRIIGSNGKLVGYAGGLPAKKRLLELESS